MTDATRRPAPGSIERFRKTMTVAEQALFTGISGNLGALHVDRAKATAAGLDDMAIFELAGASLLTTCLARIAGPGYRIARFELAFARALAVGTTIEAQARLEEVDGADLVFDLALAADGAGVAQGRATLVPVAEDR